jgi:hypothetical protein
MLRHTCRILAPAALIVACASVVALAKIKVQVDYDHAFDFSTLHTWTWYPDGPGNVRSVVTKDDDSAALKKQFEPRLLPVVEAELVKRGFPKAGAGEPDFYVTYYALMTAGSSDQIIGQFFPGPQWGIPLLPPATSTLKIFQQGSLILDITSRLTKEVVWRGVAQAEIKWEDSQAKRDARVREAVQELLKQLPPKPKKS